MAVNETGYHGPALQVNHLCICSSYVILAFRQVTVLSYSCDDAVIGYKAFSARHFLIRGEDIAVSEYLFSHGHPSCHNMVRVPLSPSTSTMVPVFMAISSSFDMPSIIGISTS